MISIGVNCSCEIKELLFVEYSALELKQTNKTEHIRGIRMLWSETERKSDGESERRVKLLDQLREGRKN